MYGILFLFIFLTWNVTYLTYSKGKIVLMMKKVITSSALLTGLLLGSFSGLASSTNHTNQNTVAATQVDVKAVDTAVKSLKQVEPVAQAEVAPTQPAVTEAVATPVEATEPVTQEVTTQAVEAVTTVNAAAETTPVQEVTEAPATTSDQSVDGALSELIHRESSGNPAAQNGQYYGIGQLSPSNYAKYAAGQDYQNNYDVQLQAMKAYIAERYGSVENALAHHNANGWY